VLRWEGGGEGGGCDRRQSLFARGAALREAGLTVQVSELLSRSRSRSRCCHQLDCTARSLARSSASGPVAASQRAVLACSLARLPSRHLPLHPRPCLCTSEVSTCAPFPPCPRARPDIQLSSLSSAAAIPRELMLPTAPVAQCHHPAQHFTAPPRLPR